MRGDGHDAETRQIIRRDEAGGDFAFRIGARAGEPERRGDEIGAHAFQVAHGRSHGGTTADDEAFVAAITRSELLRQQAVEAGEAVHGQRELRMEKLARVRCLELHEAEHAFIDGEERDIRAGDGRTGGIFDGGRHGNGFPGADVGFVRLQRDGEVLGVAFDLQGADADAILRHLILLRALRAAADDDDADEHVRRVGFRDRDADDGIFERDRRGEAAVNAIALHGDECGACDGRFDDDHGFLTGLVAGFLRLEVHAAAVLHRPRELIAADDVEGHARDDFFAIGIGGLRGEEVDAAMRRREGDARSGRAACGDGFEVVGLLVLLLQDDLILRGGAAASGGNFQRVVLLAFDAHIGLHGGAGSFAIRRDGDDFERGGLASVRKRLRAFQAEDVACAGHLKLRTGADGLLIHVRDLGLDAHDLRQRGAIRGRHGHFERGGAVIADEEIAIHKPLVFLVVIVAVDVIAIGVAILAVVSPGRRVAEVIVAEKLRRLVFALGIRAPFDVRDGDGLAHEVIRLQRHLDAVGGELRGLGVEFDLEGVRFVIVHAKADAACIADLAVGRAGAQFDLHFIRAERAGGQHEIVRPRSIGGEGDFFVDHGAVARIAHGEAAFARLRIEAQIIADEQTRVRFEMGGLAGLVERAVGEDEGAALRLPDILVGLIDVPGQAERAFAIVALHHGGVAVSLGEHKGRTRTSDFGHAARIGVAVAEELQIGIDEREAHAGKGSAGFQRGDVGEGFLAIALLHEADVGELHERLRDDAFSRSARSAGALHLDEERAGGLSGEDFRPLQRDELALIERFAAGEDAIVNRGAGIAVEGLHFVGGLLFFAAPEGIRVAFVAIHRLEQLRTGEALRTHAHLAHIRHGEFKIARAFRELAVHEGRRGDVRRIRHEFHLADEFFLHHEAVAGGDAGAHGDFVSLTDLKRAAERERAAGDLRFERACGRRLHGDAFGDLLRERGEFLRLPFFIALRDERAVRVDVHKVGRIEGRVRIRAGGDERAHIAELDALRFAELVMTGGIGERLRDL